MKQPLISVSLLALAAFPLGGAAADTIPAGLVTFFETETCPAGWQEAEYARGRLLLFTADKDLVGQAAGEPMTGGTAPAHPFVDGPLGIRLKTKWFGGINGCSNPLGADGFYSWPVKCDASDGRLPYVQLRACEKQADRPPAASDPLPWGTYAFFNRGDGKCPEGWVIEERADGRFAVPLTTPGELGGTVARPWKPATRQTLHQHSISYRLKIGPKKICPFGFNRSGIADAEQGPTDTLGVARHMLLPYVRLLVCRKDVFARDRPAGEVPAGMTIFFGGRECVDGWQRLPDSVGRFVAAAPPGAVLGRKFGGQPLADRENRAHAHSCVVSFHIKAQNVCVVGGCSFCCVAAPGSGTESISTSAAAAEVPYIQLSHCRWGER